MTDFVYEITCTGDRTQRQAVRAWFEGDVASALLELPELDAVDVYEPFVGSTHDPFVDDGPGPLLLAMLQFCSLDALVEAIADRGFAQSLAALPPQIAIAGTALERRFHPVADEAIPGPLQSPFSYVVRYHHPADDAAHFVSHYLAHHPPLLAKLPEIRSVLCYLPVHAPTTHILAPADYMIGNEVAFDSAESFNAAMASPIRRELRTHFHKLPPFSGRNTHFPMLRRRLKSPADNLSAVE